ncbi:uncharacterized protein LOC131023477 [Salvia miltiorrhiza]|uniref:uncharacterized protein LOC131023477 n=1 Tax=Salvia miltiorrhiza TaxID=226208 RepID=UPI0025AC57B5|nr:uncharacterized protein LOC131023477 [Salvia miltiorrhiza]
MLAGAQAWDVGLLNTIFSSNDIRDIISIPLPSHPTPDSLIWHYFKNGLYSVKSAYKLASSLTIDETFKVEGHWNKLWKVDVPPKVRNFLWRAARHNLPTKENFLSRGVSVGGEYATYRARFENPWHIFFACPFAEECWLAISLPPLRPSQIAVTLLLLRCSGLLRSKMRIARQLCIQAGSILCGVDAAFFREDDAMGLGLVIRNHAGDFMIGKSIKVAGVRSVDEGELMGIKEALSWIKEQGLVHGIVESDSKRAIDVIRSRARNLSEIGIIANSCREELITLPGFIIRHVKRDRNVIAHHFARAARDIDSHHVWNEPPAFVVGHLHRPCSCD